jgi:hypothetical protein
VHRKKDLTFIVLLAILIGFSIFLGYTLAYIKPVFGSSGGIHELTSHVYLEFNDEARDGLYELWDSHQDKEYSACIRGYTYAQTKNISEGYDKIILRVTEVYNAKTGTTNMAPLINCFGELGVIHNHPMIGCRDKLWTGDVQAAKMSFVAGNELFLIQCERNRIEVYTRENLYQGRVVEFG